MLFALGMSSYLLFSTWNLSLLCHITHPFISFHLSPESERMYVLELWNQ